MVWLTFGCRRRLPEEPAFTPGEAQALTVLWNQREVFPFAVAVQIARLYGRLLARIAQSEIQQWFAVVEPRLRELAPDERERATIHREVVRAAAARRGSAADRSAPALGRARGGAGRRSRRRSESG